MTVRRLVIVEWRDACKHPPQWTDTDELTDPTEYAKPECCRSVGWVMRDDRRGLSLSPNLSGANGDFGHGGLFIPRGNIVSVRTLIERTKAMPCGRRRRRKR